ncbi:MAG TPA: DEAD/DEAH box helicase [Ardenticatenaceae bacterium]|nr:DEAD/DEAH box helicase [Ardenticatenaceae bacterium]
MTAFGQFGVGPEVLRAIDEIGFEQPTPIQEATIGQLMAGRDVIAQAQTGTGKTAAFAIPIVEKIDTRSRAVQALVLAPTRELAVQVAEATHTLGRFRGVRVLPIYGGQPISRQFHSLEKGVHVVVGTPGRVLDHLRRETLSLASVCLLVLDEADEMLDMGFIEDIEAILAQAPAERQTALFSATMPPEMVALSRRFMRDPARVAIAAETATVSGVRQVYYDVGRDKVDALARILDFEQPAAAIIFTRTRVGAQEVADALEGRGYAAEPLHGDMSQVQRDAVMRRFRDGRTEILVATDVAARGLDIEHVSHVINFDIPESSDGYVHRVGRTARAGRAGVAITLVSPRERRQLVYIQRSTGATIERGRLPSPTEVAARRMELFAQSVREAIEQGDYDGYLDIADTLAAEFNPAEVAAAALKLAAEARGMAILPAPESPPTFAEDGMTRLYLDVGRRDGLRPQDIVGAIANEAKIPGRDIGVIDIFPRFAFVEVPSDRANRIMAALNKSTIKGLNVKASIARPRD